MVKTQLVRHRLVLGTAALALCIVLLGMVLRHARPVEIQEEGHPKIGQSDARIGLVLIEDFRCEGCRAFSETILPRIKQLYIDTGIAYCVFVPVAFLKGSEPLANAALAVYKIAPEQYLPFAQELFSQFNAAPLGTSLRKELLAVAGRLGGIDLMQLKRCIETDCFQDQLQQNLDWANRIMGRDFAVPALYINGKHASTDSFEKISAQIEHLRSNS